MSQQTVKGEQPRQQTDQLGTKSKPNDTIFSLKERKKEVWQKKSKKRFELSHFQVANKCQS